MKMQRTDSLFIGLLASLTFLLAGCDVERGEQAKQPEDEPARTVWKPEGSDVPDRNGREANLKLRSESAPDYGVFGQGEYPPGEAMAERPAEGGDVWIGELRIASDRYAILKQAHYIPFRREMTDGELLEAISPSLRQQHGDDLSAIIHKMHAGLRKAPQIPGENRKLFALPQGTLPSGAEKAYAEWFDKGGKLRERDILWSSPPSRELTLWAAAYRSTGEDRWARAVAEVMGIYHRLVRPPVGKIGGQVSQARHLWRTLNLGAFTPAYLEAYEAISDWPGLSERQKIDFVKGAIERAQFLHFTTTPAFPWMSYNPYGYANWLLYQAQGELAIALAFPGLKEAPKWREHAIASIALQASWSVQPDGSHDEFSYDYATQVLGQLRWCVLTLLRYGHDVPQSLQRDFFRFNESFLELYAPGGRKLPFGDSHPRDGAVANAALWAGVMSLDGRFKAFADEPEAGFLEELAAILSPDAPERWVAAYHDLPRLPPVGRTSSILPDAGWAIMRTGWGDRDHLLSFSWRGSDRVAHSGRDHLGLNIWASGHPVIRKLLGTQAYTGEYPEGYVHTPRVSNAVLLENERGELLPFARESGALRNWYSSQGFDFIDAEHFGWAHGEAGVRRRVLFLKPDWAVVVDDISTDNKKVSSQWQVHLGQEAPQIGGHHASWQRGEAYGMLWLSPAPPEAEKLAVKGEKQTYLLKGRQGNKGGASRWVSVFHFGTGEIPSELTVRSLSGEGYEGVVLPTNAGARRVIWEKEKKGAARFMATDPTDEKASDDGRFIAADPEGGVGIFSANAAEAGRVWHKGAWPIDDENEKSAGEITNFRELPWSGQPQLKQEAMALARFAWKTERSAVQMIEYREVGAQLWQRVLQPGLAREAWLLVPDLRRGKSYEMRAVAEAPGGGVTRAPIIQRSY